MIKSCITFFSICCGSPDPYLTLDFRVFEGLNLHGSHCVTTYTTSATIPGPRRHKILITSLSLTIDSPKAHTRKDFHIKVGAPNVSKNKMCHYNFMKAQYPLTENGTGCSTDRNTRKHERLFKSQEIKHEAQDVCPLEITEEALRKKIEL